MKAITKLFILMVLISSCKGNYKQSKSGAVSSEKNELETISLRYDTIVIDYDLVNEKTAQIDLSYEKLSFPEVLDSLKQLCDLQGITEITGDRLPFDGTEEMIRK